MFFLQLMKGKRRGGVVFKASHINHWVIRGHSKSCHHKQHKTHVSTFYKLQFQLRVQITQLASSRRLQLNWTKRHETVVKNDISTVTDSAHVGTDATTG